MSCEGCYRLINSKRCEALKEILQNCWAKETDIWQYIKGQEEIIAYNKENGNPKSITAARRSIRLAKASKAVIG